MEHIPVLLNEVLSFIPDGNEKLTIVDCTFGAGGYSRAILEKNPNISLIAFDRDPYVQKTADQFKKEFGNRFTFIAKPFSTLKESLNKLKISNVDGIIADIGISSMHIDHAERGFSYQNDGPLDMRMSQDGTSAKDIVNLMGEEDLRNIIKNYGEEKAAKGIARKIAEYRLTKEIETTTELRKIIDEHTNNNVKSVMRVFQAIRIAVNDELGELNATLQQAVELLNPKGILGIVSFHSLEDRMVKQFMNDVAKEKSFSRYQPETDEKPKDFTLLTTKAVKPSKKEIEYNQRARSARLRVIRRK